MTDRPFVPVDALGPEPAGAVDSRAGAFASTVQRRALWLSALAIVLDGFDNQLLGIVIPSLMTQWAVGRESFVPVIVASLLAMSVGTALAGTIGDRIGRRPAMIGSAAVFGLATLASAYATGVVSFAILRAVAAVGLGGAMPNATAMLAEFAPARRRSLAVTAGIVCVPLGGFVGGLVAASVIPDHGWRAMVAIGGVLPIVGAVLMVWLLPESPSFLADARARASRRGWLSHGEPDGAVAERSAGVAGTSIFAPAMRGDTAALWGAFFFCLLAVYAMFNWGPTMLTSAGFGIGVASAGIAAFNFGGIAGALTGAVVIDRRGSKGPMLAIAAGGALCSTVAAVLIATAQTPPLVMIVALGIQGVFINALQVTLFALAAGVYPAASRASGVGAALAVGRLGAVVSAVAGSIALTLGSGFFLVLVGAAMLASAGFLLLLKRHVTGSDRR